MIVGDELFGPEHKGEVAVIVCAFYGLRPLEMPGGTILSVLFKVIWIMSQQRQTPMYDGNLKPHQQGKSTTVILLFTLMMCSASVESQSQF